jgi:hypothetical protein
MYNRFPLLKYLTFLQIILGCNTDHKLEDVKGKIQMHAILSGQDELVCKYFQKVNNMQRLWGEKFNLIETVPKDASASDETRLQRGLKQSSELKVPKLIGLTTFTGVPRKRIHLSMLGIYCLFSPWPQKPSSFGGKPQARSTFHRPCENPTPPYPNN